jgi:hypothetical protein
MKEPLLNNTIDLVDLTDNYKTSHLTTAEYTLFSAAKELSPN